jgi:hypothetical protein
MNLGAMALPAGKRSRRCQREGQHAGIANQSRITTDPFSNLTQPEAEAAKALVSDAGCLPDRAVALVQAVAEVAAVEALDIMAGTATVSASIVDTRVTRLKRVIDHLPDDIPFPDPYEVGVIFRITTRQAQSLINTYQARYSADYREHMERQIKAAIARPTTVDKRNKWVIEFSDPTALDFAYDTLRRRGLSKSLERDRTALTLTVDRNQKDRHELDAVAALGCNVK